MNPTKNILKNHLKSLNTSFLQWYDMFRGTSLSGFVWNSQTQLIEGNDQVSDHLITVSNYDQILVLFAKDRASGAHAKTTKEKNVQLSKIVDIKVENGDEAERKTESFETKIINVVGDVTNIMRECNIIFKRAYLHHYTGDEIYQELHSSKKE
uniref:Uncharacterized protein n=1 Tax=Lactuca sativa TaxID=4236 RepID=A0A9R1X891_LACSA|nr:hypothetical protein LSAT_V11C600309070 [Lactuca sativa]